jgi:hypothetical protein
MNELNNAYIITPNSLLASCVPDANRSPQIQKSKIEKIKKSQNRKIETKQKSEPKKS